MRSLVPAYFLLVTGLCEREKGREEGSRGFLLLKAAANVVELQELHSAAVVKYECNQPHRKEHVIKIESHCKLTTNLNGERNCLERAQRVIK